ncbi:hypothetical protein BS78_10G175000 [Paspalum vaginatum]|nr:hypothetical protein BS78_10G175000 [Paspalum vaginatum]
MKHGGWWDRSTSTADLRGLALHEEWAGLAAQNPAGFPAFSLGRKPTRRLSVGCPSTSFGSPLSGGDSSMGAHFPLRNYPGLGRPGNSPIRPPQRLVRLKPLLPPRRRHLEIRPPLHVSQSSPPRPLI